jgi:hypothetical protein
VQKVKYYFTFFTQPTNRTTLFAPRQKQLKIATSRSKSYPNTSVEQSPNGNSQSYPSLAHIAKCTHKAAKTPQPAHCARETPSSLNNPANNYTETTDIAA